LTYLNAVCFYALVAFGLAWVLGHSKISLLWREFLQSPAKTPATVWPLFALAMLTLLECVGCLGFWIGVGAYYFGGMKWLVPIDLPFGAVCLGLFTAGTNLVFGRIVGLLGDENE
jgi:hypothetical protein